LAAFQELPFLGSWVASIHGPPTFHFAGGASSGWYAFSQAFPAGTFQLLIVQGQLKNDERNFSAYLNNWGPIEELDLINR
jgi:hypothetical protein